MRVNRKQGYMPTDAESEAAREARNKERIGGQEIAVYGSDGRSKLDVTEVIVQDGKIIAVWHNEQDESGRKVRAWAMGSRIRVKVEAQGVQMHAVPERVDMKGETA